MPPFLLSLLINRYTLGALLIAGVALGAYWKGYSTAAQNCREAELAAIIASQARDIAVRDAASKADKDMAAQLAADNLELQTMVQDYAKELATRPATAQCRLDGRDVERLRGIGRR